jgi:hypothetical protein
MASHLRLLCKGIATSRFAIVFDVRERERDREKQKEKEKNSARARERESFFAASFDYRHGVEAIANKLFVNARHSYFAAA